MMRSIAVEDSTLMRALLVAALVCHIASITAASFLTPHHSIQTEAISNLAIGMSPYRHLVNWGGLILPGLSLAIVSAWAKRVALFRRPASTALLGAVASGLGMALCGVFPFPSRVHLGAAVGSELLSSLVIAALAYHASRQADAVYWRYIGWGWGLFILIDVLGSVYMEAVSHRMIHPYVGIQQRLSVCGTFAIYTGALMIGIHKWRHNKRVNLTVRSSRRLLASRWFLPGTALASGAPPRHAGYPHRSTDMKAPS